MSKIDTKTEVDKENHKDGNSKITKEALTAFGDDLASMLEAEGSDYHACIRESAEVNFGIEISGDIPDQIMMFKDGGTPDI